MNFQTSCTIKIFKAILVASITMASHWLFGQSANDNMQRAISLDWNVPFHSQTDGNTVEYACIDPQLTGKCIKYHNDQWFSFISQSRSAYINISNQYCRDLFGVQLVVFEGGLCSPDTYTVHSCVSLATQDDIYISLDSLTLGTKYWLNVDGYLHDYCQFEIEVSDQPKGFSVERVILLDDTSIVANGNKVNLTWTIADSLSSKLLQVHVLRRANDEFRFTPLDSVELEFNAFGSFREIYNYTDTLYQPGIYHYLLVGKDHGGSLFYLDGLSKEIGSNSLSKINVKLDYENNTPLEIRIIDAQTDYPLNVFTINYSIRDHTHYTIYTSEYKDLTVKQLEVEVYNKKDNHLKKHYFDISR